MNCATSAKEPSLGRCSWCHSEMAPDPVSICGMNAMSKSLQFHLLTTSHVFQKKFPALSAVEKCT